MADKYPAVYLDERLELLEVEDCCILIILADESKDLAVCISKRGLVRSMQVSYYLKW